MTLFIAFLLIGGLHLSGWWYPLAVVIWAGHYLVHRWEKRFDKIDAKLRGIHSATLNGSCHYTGCKSVCKVSNR